jgi:hypothetical protein
LQGKWGEWALAAWRRLHHHALHEHTLADSHLIFYISYY